MAPDPRLVAALADRFDLERELGQGGMATVYLALDRRMRRRVALKVLRPELAAAVGPERFLREIEIAGRLQHPHILPLHESGQAGAFLYYVMPYVKGESLRDRLEREGPLPVAEVVALLRELADALAEAHAQGVVHRDVKPDNVLLSGGHAMITDFGVARALHDAAGGGAGITTAGIAIGTPAYMAPEQAAGDPATDHRADLYALGIMAYELLAGKTPFAGRTPVAVLAAHATEAPEPIQRRRPDIPVELAGIVMRCLAKRPEDRPASAAEIRAVLERMPAAPAPSIPAKRRAATWAVAAVGAAAALAGTLHLRSRPPVADRASVIAVSPFGAPSGDTALIRTGRDLPVLLSANLDGQGNIRMVDAQSVLARTRDGAPPLAEARALARRLGARAVLYGALVATGGRVRVEASLYPVAGGPALAQVTAEAARDSLTALTDSLAWGLLRQLWRGRDAPTPTVAGLTTRSWPALRAFLQGEAAFATLQIDAAEQAYARAVQLDSTFWLAWSRLNGVRSGYQGRPSDTAIANRVIAHRAELPERERAMIEIGMLSRIPDSARALNWRERVLRLLQRYPDYQMGWWSIADIDLHFGGVRYGTSIDEITAELRRAVELNPAYGPALTHLEEVSFLRDSALYSETRRMKEQFQWATFWDTVGPSPEQLRRAWLTPTRAETLDSDRAGKLRRVQIPRFLPAIVNMAPQILAQVATGRHLTGQEEDFARARVYAHATRGGWDSALQETRSLPPAAGPLEAYRLAVVGAWIGGLPLDEVARRRTALGPPPSDARAEVAWLDGVAALTRGDGDGLRRARQDLLASGDPGSALLDRALAALERLRVGRDLDAADTLEQLEWDRTWLADGQDAWNVGPSVPLHRLAAARALAQRGDTARAVRLLNWVDGSPLLVGYGLALLRPYALLERAKLFEGQGDSRRARLDYEAFLRHFDRPVGPLAELRAEGERGYARVSGAREVQRD